MDFKDISPELREKARACNSAEELVALAEAEGIELTDEQLEAVSGGWKSPFTCAAPQYYGKGGKLEN